MPTQLRFDPLSIATEPSWWAIVGIVLGLYFFVSGFAALRRKRLLDSIPRSTIRGAALGLVEVSGRATGPYSIVAPLSETECYFYKAVASPLSSDDGHRVWKKPVEETLCVPFFLDDGTGKLLVDPRGAETYLRPSLCESLSSSEIPDYMRRFLGRRGVPPGTSVKLEEYCIRADDQLFVHGAICENPGLAPVAGPQIDVQPDSLRYLSREAADLQCEMAFPRPAPHAPEPAPNSPFATDGFDLSPPTVLMKGRPEDIFIISWSSRRDLVRGLALVSTLSIWGGPALALASLCVLFSRLGWL